MGGNKKESRVFSVPVYVGVIDVPDVFLKKRLFFRLYVAVCRIGG